MIRNINTYTQIGFLLVIGGVFLAIAIIGVLLLSKYKDSGTSTPAKTNRINILATVLYGTVAGMIELGIVFSLLF